MTIQTAPLEPRPPAGLRDTVPVGAGSAPGDGNRSIRTSDAEPGADVLACGFGMTVAAWIAAYVSRMPIWGAPAPGQVTILLMLMMVFLGGILAARYSLKGLWAAVWAGAVSGVLDILVVGSVLHDAAKGSAPGAVVWISGSIVLNAVVAGLGGLVGRLFPAASRSRVRWTPVFVLVLGAATLPLITAGGLVTAFRAGLAVPDWPQSYGYNMFLFPLSQMQSASGNFYEHAHRLMGSLVGVTALTLAVFALVTQWSARRWLVGATWLIGVAVAIQGVMGGLRVTEKSVALAAIHGIFAQVVFAGMACVAVASMPRFARADELPAEGRPTGAAAPVILVVLMLVQLTLGALLRQHVNSMLILHVMMAAFVALLAASCGFRAFVLHGAIPSLRRTGLAVIVLVSLQLLLGIVALVVRPTGEAEPTTVSALFTTAHQANGALLLCGCAVLAMWTWRARGEGSAGASQLSA